VHQVVGELWEVWELAQKVLGAQPQSRTCMVSLDWHLYQLHLGCAIWASRRRIGHLIELLELPMYRPTR
jgi:DMSO/TMAO reductase YedYZ heme-binding membrane subunit